MQLEVLDAAFAAREALRARLAADGSDAFRLLHGTVEGWPGLCVDRYGPHVLIQTFREPLDTDTLTRLSDRVRALLGEELPCVYNHRGGKNLPFALWHEPSEEDIAPGTCREHGLDFEVRPRHRGRDPLLFLDLRVGRRFVRAHADQKSVLNLFAYTCGIGVAAAVGGAKEVWNLDFARTALEVGEANAVLNRVDGPGFKLLREDFFPAVRQLAGLKVKGRGARRRYRRFAARQFDLVVLDPPRWAKSPFGAVDVVRDYPSLFKPALLATAPGGILLASNNVAAVGLDEWLDILRRSAQKAGRPLRGVEVLAPDEDFPSSDGKHPLKLAVCEV